MGAELHAGSVDKAGLGPEGSMQTTKHRSRGWLLGVALSSLAIFSAGCGRGEDPPAEATPPPFNPFEGGSITWGSACGEGGLEHWLVFTPEAATCSDHAQAFSGGLQGDGAVVAIPEVRAATVLEREGEVCLDERCRLRRFRIEVDAVGPPLVGRWRFSTDDAVAAGALAAERCDYLSHLPTEPELEDLLEVEEVALYQGVKRPLVGASVGFAPEIPAVSKRPALLRVFFSPRRALIGRVLSGRLDWDAEDGQPPHVFSSTATVYGRSTDGALASSLNFEIPASAMTSGVEWSLEIRDETVCPPPEASTPTFRIPTTGTHTLQSWDVGPLDVTLVPFRYLPDGSGRLPDLSPERLRIYREVLLGMFPVEDVRIRVRPPVDWDRTISGDARSWTPLLIELYALRARDAPPPSTYYYGLIQPTEEFRAYRGTVAGVASVAGPSSVGTRGGVGLGYPVPFSGDIMAHELGHAMGRLHAPCGDPESVDPDFPDANLGATLGSWGYDHIGSTLLDPRTHKDFMSYCSPTWISDYSFARLVERLAFVLNAARLQRGPELRGRLVGFGPSGPFWSKPMDLVMPDGSALPVRYLDSDLQILGAAKGGVLRIDHRPEPIFVVPEPPAGTVFVQVESEPPFDGPATR